MVKFQIKLKGMKHTITCKQMFPLSHTLTPGVGLKDIFFSEVSYAACQNNGNEAEYTSSPFFTQYLLIGQKARTFFSEEGDVA